MNHLHWIGCGDCDTSFPCHDGRERCIRGFRDAAHVPATPRETPSERQARHLGLIDRALEGTGFKASELLQEAFRVLGDSPPDPEARSPKPEARSLKPEALPSDPRCPDCKYDHEREGAGASCLRARTDDDLARECERRWKMDPRDGRTALNDAFDLLVDVGGALDEAIAARVLGRGENVARKVSLRSRHFLASTVKKFPWLSPLAPDVYGPRCGSCRDTGRWSTGIRCPACTPPSGVRCTARESGGVQCELDAVHVELGIQHACPEALKRFVQRRLEWYAAHPKASSPSESAASSQQPAADAQRESESPPPAEKASES